MHRALMTEELQHSIFAYLLDMFESFAQPKHEQSTLLSVARTCQAFTEVALDILYRNIRFHDLLQVWHVRGILKRVEKPSAKSQEIVFDRVPNPSEYQRLSYYSRRVQILEVRYEWWTVPQYSDFGYGANFFPTFIEMMVDRGTNRDDLFPQLQSLTWSGSSEVELVGCEAIIQASPRLKAFEYGEYRSDLPSSAESWPTLLRALASAQSLEKIRISLDRPVIGPIGPGTRAGLALSYLIMKPSLKELELPDYVVESTVVMSSFASARQLEKLVLSYARKSVTGAAKVPRTASLDQLSYLTGTPEGMESILTMPFVFRALTTLTTDDVLGASFTFSHLPTFCELVGKVCPVLETLHLSADVYRDHVDQRADFVLAPLKACTRIQCFKLHAITLASDGPKISVPLAFNPTDLDWRYLISQWPNLQQMSYHFSGHPEGGEYYRRLDPGPRATVRTLMEFSRFCRQLETLTVPITATSHDANAALQDDILPFSNSMSSINFFNYSIEDNAVEGVAMLLLRLTRDDVEFNWETWVYPEDMDGFDRRNDKNWRAAKSHIDFTRKARPIAPPVSPGTRGMTVKEV